MNRPTALITGSAVRVGRAIALALAPHFDLALHYRRSLQEIEEVAEQCRALGSQVALFSADLAHATACQLLTEQVASHFSQLHLLVNNASLFSPVPFSQITLNQWEEMQAVNVRAPFLLSQGLLPLLQKADPTLVGGPASQGGLVVHLCDIGGERPVAGYAHYSVSKAALAMLVKAMAVELAPQVRCVGISPGQVIWPDSYDENLRSRLEKRIPLQRVGTPEEVGKLVKFLVLEGHYLNGNLLAMDGGLSVRY